MAHPAKCQRIELPLGDKSFAKFLKYFFPKNNDPCLPLCMENYSPWHISHKS